MDAKLSFEACWGKDLQQPQLISTSGLFAHINVDQGPYGPREDYRLIMEPQDLYILGYSSETATPASREVAKGSFHASVLALTPEKDNVLRITHFIVTSAWRRRGYGRATLRFAADNALRYFPEARWLRIRIAFGEVGIKRLIDEQGFWETFVKNEKPPEEFVTYMRRLAP